MMQPLNLQKLWDGKGHVDARRMSPYNNDDMTW